MVKALRTDTIVFTGIDTYVCVESTVRDAFNKGYDVILLKDCVASRNPKHHADSIEQITEAYGLVLDSDDFMKMIENKQIILFTENNPK